MGFVTFILLTNFKLGSQGSKFDPDLLMWTYSKSLSIWMLEAIIEKMLCFFLSVGNPSFLELVAFSGYKFIM